MMARGRSLVPLVYVLVAANALLLGGCLERKLKPLNPCLVSGVVAEIAVTNIDKVDMLFMVDNSGSMKEEQESLRSEFPKLIRVLTTGDRGDGSPMFPPAKDLHLGVVSSDLGLVGISDIDKCDGLGDDGIMLNTPSPAVQGCQASYPRFLSYVAGVNDATTTARDFGCIAALGTEGCGFEQQLESALKALWPKTDPMPEMPGKNRITFLGDPQGFGQDGQGDGPNAGFLRNDPMMGLSLIAIIMVTDEEDCSSLDTRHFTPMHFLDPNDPLAMQDLNLRCHFNPQNLYPLERYVKGFKALRPGAENLVIFGAIAGVPPDLVEPQDYEAAGDWTEKANRDAFYARILNDQRMIETVDPNRTPQQGANLVPSCNTARGRAYPPIRIVKVAQEFGANGTVHSICQENLGPAIDAIIEVIARQLGAVCLPRPLVRNSDGLVDCNVVWELPPPGANVNVKTPTSCNTEGFPFLQPPDEGRTPVTENGGAVCKISQLAVKGDGDQKMQTPTPDDNGVMQNDGWYYDDFSKEVKMECTGETKQRVAFTPNAKPPTGVTVKLECLNERQSLADNRTDTQMNQPKIGDSCDEVMVNGRILDGDEACYVNLLQPNPKFSNPMVDTSMFCHPKLNICVLSCQTSANCPAAWVCDDRMETLAMTADSGGNGRAICINPTCGDSSK